MKVVCVICTEQLLINSHISVCSCGHLFHEDCLFKWIRTGQSTCPQCRCKLKEKEIIKRLYLTEYDITASQSTSGFDSKSIEVTADNFERLLNKVEELKNSVKEQTELLSTKSKLIEQNEKKLKESETLLNNTKKNLSERQLLIDYLKKELENYSKIKDQNDLKSRQIEELELKLREFRSVEMIYKEHEATFAVEMNKYLTQASNPNLSQTIIRQLVNTNVLLKEHSDKQMEEKRLLRKKLIQIERTNTELNNKFDKTEQELRDLRNSNEKLRIECKLKDNEIKNLKSSSQFSNNAQSTPSLNKENILVNNLKSNSSCLIVNDTIEFEDNESAGVANKSGNGDGVDCSLTKPMNNSNNDSDLKYLDELNKLDFKSNNRMDDLSIDMNDSDTPLPLAKKRKNPFVAPTVELDDDNDEIRPNQIQNNKFNKMQKFKSFNELSLSQRFKESPIEIEIVKPIVTNNNLKRSRLNLNESIVNSSTSSGQKAFNYLSDGLGGRAKITNSGTTTSSNNLINNNNNNASKGIVKKHNFLTKSKVSNFK